VWIMIAGPYRAGSADPAVWADNLRALNAAAHAILERGHVPVIGVNMALPVIESAGPGSYDRIMLPLSLSLTERCDAVLRIGGASGGADAEIDRFRSRGLPVFRSVDEVPDTRRPASAAPRESGSAAAPAAAPIQIVDRRPSVEEYGRLIAAVGWKPRDPKAIARAMAGSLFAVCATAGDEVIGMGRVIGDGGLHYYLTDVVVVPAHQHRHGRLLRAPRLPGPAPERSRDVPLAEPKRHLKAR
jgi:hypothetical protein